MIYQCFENEVFDPTINECVEKCEVKENVCVGNPSIRVIINPCNCASFIICYLEKIVSITDCEAGKIFDEISGE